MSKQKKVVAPAVELVEFDIPELDEFVQDSSKIEEAKYLKAEAYDFIEQKHRLDLRIEEIKEAQAKVNADLRAMVAKQEEVIAERAKRINERMSALHNPALAEKAIDAGRISKKAGESFIGSLVGKRKVALANDRVRIEAEYKPILDPLATMAAKLNQEYLDTVSKKKAASRNADAKFAALNALL